MSAKRPKALSPLEKLLLKLDPHMAEVDNKSAEEVREELRRNGVDTRSVKKRILEIVKRLITAGPLGLLITWAWPKTKVASFCDASWIKKAGVAAAVLLIVGSGYALMPDDEKTKYRQLVKEVRKLEKEWEADPGNYEITRKLAFARQKLANETLRLYSAEEAKATQLRKEAAAQLRLLAQAQPRNFKPGADRVPPMHGDRPRDAVAMDVAHAPAGIFVHAPAPRVPVAQPIRNAPQRAALPPKLIQQHELQPNRGVIAQ